MAVFGKSKDKVVTEGSLCWTTDADLLARRAEQDAADKRLIDLEASVAIGEADVAAAKNAVRVAKGRRAVKEGDDASVRNAEADLARAQQVLEEADGQLDSLRRRIDGLRHQAQDALDAAKTRSAGAYRSTYAGKSCELGKVLRRARELALDLERTYDAASRSFSWGSPESKALGEAAGLCGIHGGPAHQALRVLLPDRPGIPETGRIEEWARVVHHVLGVDPLAVRDVTK